MATVVGHHREEKVPMCAFCSEVCTDPVQVPCHHTFCWDCIDHWCALKQPGNKAVCPTCGTAFIIPDNGIVGLKAGLAPEDLVIQWSSSESNQMTDDKREYQNIPAVCAVHKMPRDRYCFIDNKAVCKKCEAADSRSLKFGDVKDVANEYRIDLKRDVETIMNAKRKVVEKVSTLSSRKLEFLEDVKSVKKLINDKADAMIEMINKHRNEHISEVENIKSRHEKEIEKCISDIITEKKLLEDSITSYNNFLKETDVEISEGASEFIKRTSKLAGLKRVNDAFNSLCVTKVHFSPSRFANDCPQLTLGTVTDEVIPINVAQIMTKGEKGVAAVALLNKNNELFVTRCHVKDVFVYDSVTLQLKRSISVPKLGQEPYGLAACPFNNFLYISESFYHRVHRVELSTDTITSWEVSTAPRALSLTRKHNLLVAFGYYLSHEIQEFTPEGTLIRQISNEDWLWHAIETRDNTLMVSRSGGSRGIIELQWDGQVKRCYDNKVRKGQMSSPRSLFVTANGDVLVADTDSSSVQELDSSLTTVRILQLPANITLNQPIALCYDASRDRLFVGEAGGQYRVIAFDHVIFK